MNKMNFSMLRRECPSTFLASVLEVLRNEGVSEGGVIDQEVSLCDDGPNHLTIYERHNATGVEAPVFVRAMIKALTETLGTPIRVDGITFSSQDPGSRIAFSFLSSDSERSVTWFGCSPYLLDALSSGCFVLDAPTAYDMVPHQQFDEYIGTFILSSE